MFTLQLLVAAIFDPSFAVNRTLLDLGFWKPFSRKMESEADYIGLLLMSKACYDPEAATRVWERMKSMGDHQPLEYMSTHPSHGSRIKNIQEWMPEAEKAWQEADCSSFKEFKKFAFW